MEWAVLAVLTGIGFILVILEFLVFPGTNVVGIIGLACICFGIYIGYKSFGAATGHIIVLVTAAGGIGLTWYVLRAKTWKRLCLDSSIDSKVEGVDPSIRPGDKGICIGRLAPMGKVKVGDQVVEALSESGYIDANREVEVVKVYADKIIVKLKTEENG